MRQAIGAHRPTKWSPALLTCLFDQTLCDIAPDRCRWTISNRKSRFLSSPWTPHALFLYSSTHLDWHGLKLDLQIPIEPGAMFGLTNDGASYRSRSQLRNLRTRAKRDAVLRMSQFDDTWMPIPNSLSYPDFTHFSWPRLPSQLDGMLDPFARGSVPYGEIAYPGRRLDPFEEYGRQPRAATAFERAAATLNDAFDSTLRFCKDIEKQFENEMSSVGMWVGPKCVEELWGMKLDWDGVPASTPSRRRDTRNISSTMTYNTTVRNLYRAFDDFQASHGDNSNHYSERLKTALNKLFMTFQGIEELVESVRTHRERMPALHKELNSAQNLLHDSRDMWMQHRGTLERRCNTSDDSMHERRGEWSNQAGRSRSKDRTVMYF